MVGKGFVSTTLPFKHNGIVGSSPVMKTLDEQIVTAAGSDLSVLITGESGTGKELVARAIHNCSARTESPFISFNCGAINESLLESELFGYERGAFTGANQSRRGLFEAKEVAALLARHEAGQMNASNRLYALLVFETWAEKYL